METTNEVLGDNLSPEPAPAKEGYVRIVLEENENIPPSGQFIGHNGKGYLLRPGVEVDVPAVLCDILDQAIEDRPVVGPDKRVVGYRKALRFPYRRVYSR